jgi:hypothetical protein
MIIIIITVLLILLCCYYNFQKKSEIISCKEYTWEIKRLEKIGNCRSENISLQDNEILVVYGKIPEDYLYWNFDIFNLQNQCQYSISMGKYQSVFPGTNICLCISRNHHLIIETKKLCEKNHYQRFPNRRLIFEIIPYSEPFFLFFEECFRNSYENIAHFGFSKYIYKCQKFSSFFNLPSSEEYYVPSTNEKRSKILNSFIENKFSNFEWRSIKVLKNNLVENISSNAIVNVSEPIFLNGPTKICVIALDHFMSRSAIHSHLLFVDAETSNVLYVYFTGLISKKINTGNCKTFHTVEYNPSHNIKRLIIYEKIFYDPNTGKRPSSHKIIPMMIFVS